MGQDLSKSSLEVAGATADVAVIGAGVVGSSIALELARSGRSVVVLDKAGGVGMGSTSASSAIVRFNYSTWEGVAASWESWHSWQDWTGHLGHRPPDVAAAFVRTGMLVLDEGGGRPVTAHFDRAGITWEAWGADEIRSRLGYLDVGAYGPPKPVTSDDFFAGPHGEVSGLMTPDAGFVNDPQLATQNLAAAASARGARYLLRRTVTSVTTAGGGWRIETLEGTTVTAGAVVNAAGPWSGAVNSLAGIGSDFTVTTRPLRQEVHRVDAPAGLDDPDRPGLTLADPDLGIYIRADAGGLLVGGMEPACDPLEWLDDPEDSNPAPTVAQFEAQVLRASRRLPELRVPPRPSGIAGVYDASSDWAPIYDRTAEPGFYVAMGTSGNQFKNAPVIGQFMRAIIDATESGHDHDAVPVRFTGPHTGLQLDLGAFSRKRRLAIDAPSSVLG